MSIYRYWGKAKKDHDGAGPDYHLLPYHCLDVAAVGWHLLNPEGELCQSLAQQLDVEPEWLQQWFCFCLMLHDIGKFGRCFQNLAPDLSKQLVPSRLGKDNCRHDTLGFALWQKGLYRRLLDIFPSTKVYEGIIEDWLRVVCGHHGVPPQNLRAIKNYLIPEEDIPAAEAFVRTLAEHWLPDITPLANINEESFTKASWQLAGITVLADWLGSNKDIFKYCSKPDIPLENYWQSTALPAAASVLAKNEYQPKAIRPFSSITQQFEFIHKPTPLQAFAETVEIPQSPQLFILEDVTGAGKTEAAMVLVHRLMSAGLAAGLYVGLPTMATANGMYQRLSKSYQTLFQGEIKPSLVLAHGASKLSEAFQESVQLSEQPTDRSYQKDEKSATAYCNKWLADSRKKALLADVGIGTIDQALLAVLPARHQSLRMLGLRNKVLLLDEVHAYDPYMRQLLSALLRSHAAQGGSVILLSATLPQQFRYQLLKAYRCGRGLHSHTLQNTKGYPLVTHSADHGHPDEHVVATRKSVRRTVKIKRVAHIDAAIQLICNAVIEKQCICWIRNSIKDAREIYHQLQNNAAVSKKVTLFHSRFAMGDRQAIEQDVLHRFGRESTAEQRASQILIATQVVEQSLDLDFDILISDPAPVDLIIQRAGRLQRHMRDQHGNKNDNLPKDQRSEPCLYLHTPDPEEVDNEQWLQATLPRTQSVYPHVGQVWLTMKLLLQKKGFTMPEDARDLIEGVYGSKAQEKIPVLLQQQSNSAEADDSARGNMGRFNCLELELGYNWDSGGAANGWDEDTNIPTRLNEWETVTALLVIPDAQGNLMPWAKSEIWEHRWLLSQIQLPQNEWEQAQTFIPPQWQSAAEILKKNNRALKYLHILPLVEETKHFYCAKGGWDLERKSNDESNQ